MQKIMVLLLCVGLCGCATATAPVVPFGLDTYKIAQEASGLCNTTVATTSVIQRGNEHCQMLGKNFMPISSNTELCSYELTFRCLDEGDPELKRPDIEFVPDVVIENRKE